MKRLLGLFLAAAGIAFAQPTVPLSNVRIQGTNNQVNSASSLLAASGGTLGISNGGTFTFNTSSLFSGDAPAFRAAIGAGTGTGSVTSVSVVTANGVSGSVANPTTTPAITLTLGAITPTTVNGLTISPTSGTLSLANSSTHATVGAFTSTFTFTGTTGVTFPTSGTLATLAGAEALTNKTYNGNTWTTGTGTLTLGNSTINVAGNLTTSGAFGSTFTMTGTTAVTFPTSGTLATTGGSVPSIQGTANQVLVNGTSGSPVAGSAITLTTPQNIATTSSPTFANLTDSGLTAGRVTFAGTSGILSDDSDLTFAADTLTFTKGIAPTSLLVGTSTAPSLNGSASVFTTVDTAATLPRGISNVQYSTDVNSANFSGYKARGTQSSPTIIAASDILTNFRAWGYDGTNTTSGWLNMGSFRFRVPSGAVPVATSVPTEAVLSIGSNATPSVLTDTALFSSTTGITLTALGTNQNLSLSTNGTGAVAVPNATAASSITTGALQVTGGVGVSGTSFYGGSIIVTSNSADNSFIAGSGLKLSSNGRSDIQADSYSGAGSSGSFLMGRLARGTLASPTALSANDVMLSLSTRGYGSTQFGTASPALMQFMAAEAFTDSAQGGLITFGTAPTGGTANTEAARITSARNLLVGGTTDVTGNGSIYASNIVFIGTTTSTSGVTNAPVIEAAVASGSADTARFTRLTNSAGSTIGRLMFAGRDSSNAITDYARIQGVITANTAGSATGAFSVSTRRAGTLTEAFRATDTGNLLIGTTTDITGNGGVAIASSTAATSTTTGALQVAGGVGVAGALYVGSSGATISGGAGNMTITSGTGASRTMTLQTTTSGSAATTFMSADATQNITVSNKITSYNGIATAGNGVVTVQGAGRATAQVAANASVATYTVGAADASFVVSANVRVTTSSAEAFTVTCAYTDEGNTSRTITMNFQLVAGTIGTAINFANGAVPYEGIPVHIRAKASSTITIATTGTFTGSTYNVEGVIQKLQ